MNRFFHYFAPLHPTSYVCSNKMGIIIREKTESMNALEYTKLACGLLTAIIGVGGFKVYTDKQLTDKQITELVTNGKTPLIKGFKSKNGKAFDASLAFDEQFNVTFVFPEKKGKTKK